MAKFKQMVDVLDLSVVMYRFVAENGETLDVNVSAKLSFVERPLKAMAIALSKGFDWVEFGEVDRFLPFIKR